MPGSREARAVDEQRRGRGGRGRHVDDDARAPHPELRELARRSRPPARRRPRGACARARARRPPPRRPVAAFSSSSVASTVRRARERVELGGQRRAVGEELRGRRPVLAQELLQAERALLDLGQPLGARLDALGVAGERPRRVGELGPRRLDGARVRQRATRRWRRPGRARPRGARARRRWAPRPRRAARPRAASPPGGARRGAGGRARARAPSPRPSRTSSSSISRICQRRKSSRSARPRSSALGRFELAHDRAQRLDLLGEPQRARPRACRTRRGTRRGSPDRSATRSRAARRCRRGRTPSSASCGGRAEAPVDVGPAPRLLLRRRRRRARRPARRAGRRARPRPPGPPPRAAPAARPPGATSKSASTSASSAPLRTSSGRARPPRTRDRASTSIDFPAPVSPVTTLNPGESSSTRRSIRTTFRTLSWASTAAVRTTIAAQPVRRPSGRASGLLTSRERTSLPCMRISVVSHAP